MGAKTPFSIYQYASSTEYFVDAYAHLHAQDPTFSYERISELAGFRSRSYSRNLIKGIQTPSDSDLKALARVFEFSNDETTYLLHLSAFQSSGGGEVARTLFEKLIQMQKRFAPEARPFREAEVATSVLHMTLLSACDLPNAPETAEELAKLLKNRYAVSDIENALVELVTLGFLKKDAASGKLVSVGKHWKKYDFNANYFLRQFHRECLALAAESLENESPTERYLVGASFAIHEKIFPRIVQKLNSFVENLMTLEGVAGPSDTIVQLNVQLIKTGSISLLNPLNNEPGLRAASAAERALDLPSPQSLPSAKSPGDLPTSEH